MFHCLDFRINECEAKQDQIPVSGEAEFSVGKGNCELLGEQDHGTRIYGRFPVSRSMNY